MTPENIEAALRKQIEKSEEALRDAGYDPAAVRERIAGLSQQYGGPVLDVGTGACACLAVVIAHKGLQVTAVDRASSAVRIAQERTAGLLHARLDIQHIDAANLPYLDGSYRIVTAFDALCHAAEPEAILKEMFRVTRSVVIVTELNTAGRQITQHHDGAFEKALPGLLARYCHECRQIHDAHHVTFVCEKPYHDAFDAMCRGGRAGENPCC